MGVSAEIGSVRARLRARVGDDPGPSVECPSRAAPRGGSELESRPPRVPSGQGLRQPWISLTTATPGCGVARPPDAVSVIIPISNHVPLAVGLLDPTRALSYRRWGLAAGTRTSTADQPAIADRSIAWVTRVLKAATPARSAAPEGDVVAPIHPAPFPTDAQVHAVRMAAGGISE